MSSGDAFFWNHAGTPLPQPRLLVMSPWLSSTTAMPSLSVRSSTACSRFTKSASSESSSRGCAPAQTTPSRMLFQPMLFMCEMSAALKVAHDVQLPSLLQTAPAGPSVTSLQMVVPVVAGMYGGPFTTTFAPRMTIGSPVAARMNCWSLMRTSRATAGGGGAVEAETAQTVALSAASTSEQRSMLSVRTCGCSVFTPGPGLPIAGYGVILTLRKSQITCANPRR